MKKEKLETLDITWLQYGVKTIQIIFLNKQTLDYVKSRIASINDSSLSRISHQWCSIKKRIYKNFAKFTGKYLCQNLFFNKVESSQFYQKRLWHRCFLVNVAKVLQITILQNTSGRLLLSFHKLWRLRHKGY